ncbi:MAG: putative metal-binding motif-containing protein [Sandaracinus sp.]|nr:putative metal-binding motif-containing protein [Sandaracinus sp.]MCB9620048.1 putative metal-binding motif-containing protein [Sandaracinus sp.]MCB9622390.1 putative metal-binding motif-containing protein [Sandaracinus sp.]MCB9631688.1 putative metal-binding motif-containing protein [Sandaracinus sp.]
MKAWLWLALLTVGACGNSPAGSEDGSMPGFDGSATICRNGSECSDGLFCNGEELCLPTADGADARGCVSGTMACLEGQACDEASDRCVTACDAEGDADGDGVRAMECGGTDCDDSDPARAPGNREICDPDDVDEDCDATTFGIRDQDGDDEPDAACCNTAPSGDVLCGTDCDDTRAGVNRTATETCNGRDDDCDGSVDEGVLATLYRDVDGDTFGDSSAVMMGCPGLVEGYVLEGGDCNDELGSINPAAADTCDPDELDEDCSGTPNDPPGGCDCTAGETRRCVALGICAAGTESCSEGVFSGCSIAPEAFETCDGEDDDCNGVVDDGLRRTCWVDRDDDGFAAMGASSEELCATPGGGCPTGHTPRDPSVTADCDDSPTGGGRYPSNTESCNLIDDDCDGTTDEGLTVGCYVDEDNDTYAAMGATLQPQCPNAARTSVGFCPIGFTNRAPVSTATRDCNDTPGTGFDVRPGAPELCDSIDNDCNGMIDDGARVLCYADPDDDGYSDTGATSSMLCRDGTRADRGDCPRMFTFRDPSMRDCMEGDPSVFPGAVELCDAIDQDCDGRIDDAMMVTCYPDPDNDTYPAAGIGSVTQCPDAVRSAVGNCPSGYTNVAPGTGVDDCAPMDITRHPAVTETCDEPTFVDSNCNPSDEGSQTCWRDADDDGYAALSASTITACTVTSRNDATHLGCPMGYTGRNPSSDAAADCADGDATRRQIVRCYRDVDRDGYRASTSTATAQCVTAGQGYGNCPTGWTARTSPVDCCDSDNRARPGQTTYYSTARTTCGGYDFDCNGGESRRYTTNWGSQLCAGTTLASCEGDVTAGWESASDPTCGTSAAWVDCAFVDDLEPPGPSTLCVRGSGMLTQACR